MTCRWAVNNIATMDNPPCKPLLSMLHDNKTALDPYMMNTTDRAAQVSEGHMAGT
jgi:hypothetical protein